MENFTQTGHIEGKIVGKQQVTYLMRDKVVESHDYPYPEGVWHIKDSSYKALKPFSTILQIIFFYKNRYMTWVAQSKQCESV